MKDSSTLQRDSAPRDTAPRDNVQRDTAQRVMRRVPYPADPARVAEGLSIEPAWCWLDGVEGERSYLGVARCVLTAEVGHEASFLAQISGEPVAARPIAHGFTGGWVVALAYEFGVSLLRAAAQAPAAPLTDEKSSGEHPAGENPGNGPHPTPHSTSGFAPPAEAPGFALDIDVVLALDTRSRVAELWGPDDAALDTWWARFGSFFEPPADREAVGAEPRHQANAAVAGDMAVRWGHTDTAYASLVEDCRSRIADGDAYVMCLTDTAEVHAPPQTLFDPLALYRQLRGASGALRGGVIVAGDRALVSLSPERFISVHGRSVSTHPIKGTRPRGAHAADDARNARELAADPKERAENLMIVDLMRNDLSRVCVPGSVRVDGFLRVEAHPHVHQLVSTVTGELAPECGLSHVLTACFPGGSMTGAPKRSAVDMLQRLEGRPRGLYSGCFGWVDHLGDAELAMTIRSVELRDGGARALVGAGGGITIDSDAAQELAEKHLKAAPLVSALRAWARYS